MRKNMNFNGVNTEDCPCRNCVDRTIACHGKCLKYIDWKQAHEVKLAHIREAKRIDKLMFDNQAKRNKKLKQQGGIKYGRRYDSD